MNVLRELLAIVDCRFIVGGPNRYGFIVDSGLPLYFFQCCSILDYKCGLLHTFRSFKDASSGIVTIPTCLSVICLIIQDIANGQVLLPLAGKVTARQDGDTRHYTRLLSPPASPHRVSLSERAHSGL